jgi:plastocyanin
MLRLRLACILCAFVGGGLSLAAQSGYEALVRTAEGKPVADAILSLTPLDGQAMPAAAAPTAPAARIAQTGQEYEPLVTPIRTGSPIEFPNLDTVQHHIYSVSKPKRFEIPLYDGGRTETVVFEQPGIVTIGCNIHDWMLAYVVVLDTPWFVKTPADGRASFTGLPGGRYRLDLWHPLLTKPIAREVTLAAAAGGVPEEFTLALRPDRRLRRAPASGAGAGY